MEEIKNVKNGRYTLNGKFEFDIQDGILKIDAKDALEIAYTLFDWAGKDYVILNEIDNELFEK